MRKLFERWSVSTQKLATEPDPKGRRGWRKAKGGWRGWLEGRAWLSRDFAQRTEKTIRFSWDLGRLGLAAEAYLGPCPMNDGDHGVTFHVAVPGASLFLGLEGLVPAWLLPGGRPVSGGRRLERTPGREIGVRFHDGKAWVDVWSPGGGGVRRSDPWWVKGVVIDPVKILLGRRTTSSADESLGQVEIPMPEGVYLANATLHHHVDKRRGLVVGRWWRISFDEFEGPNGESSIPYPGKGTAAYNCGMDGCIGMSAPQGLELPEAIGHVVADVLRTRRSRTGNPFWRLEPEAEANS